MDWNGRHRTGSRFDYLVSVGIQAKGHHVRPVIGSHHNQICVECLSCRYKFIRRFSHSNTARTANLIVLSYFVPLVAESGHFLPGYANCPSTHQPIARSVEGVFTRSELPDDQAEVAAARVIAGEADIRQR